jgi:hypothetical protein
MLDRDERNVLKEVCNLLATAWKVAQLKVMQISLIIEVVTQHSAFTNSSMIKRAQGHCQNMDRECVPSSSGIDIILTVAKLREFD